MSASVTDVFLQFQLLRSE